MFCMLNDPALISTNDKYLQKHIKSLFSFIHVMFSSHNLILWQISSNFIVKFISVFCCAKETTSFLSDTDTEAILKQNLGDSSGQNVFFSYGTGCLGANGLFHFLSVPTGTWM